jgi:hypothetical protein
MTLLQKINQQQTTPQNNLQNSSNSQIPQNFQNLNQSQSQMNSLNQVNLPNPISILNEMHQRHRLSNGPPKYDFTMDSTTGHFYCQLEVFGKLFKTEHPTLRKQQAKENAALMAIRNFVNNNNNNPLSTKSYIGSDIMKLYEPSSINFKSDTCKSELWYRKQLNESPEKQPRVILLEFCQMHCLPTPIYQPFNDYNGNTFYECIVGDKCFRSDRSFPKSSEAKDYIAHHTFEVIYKEMCEKEQKLNEGHNKSSLLDFIENYQLKNSNNLSDNNNILNSTHSFTGGNIGSNINNISSNPSFGPHYTIGNPQSHVSSMNNISNVSSINSSHLHSNVTSPPLGINSTSSSHLSSHLTSPHYNSSHSLFSNITSPHSPISTNSNSSSNSLFSSHSSSHLNMGLGLPSPNIKIEEGSSIDSDLSFIKTEEGSINYSPRDQHQQSTSSISFHPYRTPGRERFPPNPGLNNINSNINNSLLNQQTKKNIKKFTSLLYEMAQSKRWSPPEFNFENGINGFICTCSIQNCFFKGKAFPRKMDAKESAAEEAYHFLIRSNFRV